MLNNIEFNIQYYLIYIVKEKKILMKIKKYALFFLKLTKYTKYRFLICKLNLV